MVNLLIKKARVIDEHSDWNNKKVDILIKNGVVEEIAKNISSKYRAIEIPNLHVSPGWYDLNVNFRDPGFEHKEDVHSGLSAAAAGGFARVCVNPDTEPAISDKSGVEYLINKANTHVCSLSVMGAITKDLKGNDLAEMYDMHNSGAVLFGEGNKHLDNGGLMNKALLYAKSFNATLVSRPLDKSIAGVGEINEGVQSISMGLKGIPSVAETIALARDIELLGYSGGRLHVASISTEGSVDLIRKAKRKGLEITASVSIIHLIKTDTDLDGFDVNYKISPPLRTEKDRKALVKGIVDGTIDAITSDHSPEDVEEKKVAFSQASPGMIALESFYGLHGKYLVNEIPLNRFIDCISRAPYRITQEQYHEVAVGAKASLTCFVPEKEWIFGKDKIVSKSANTPFIDDILVGKVMGIVNNNKSTL